MTATLIPADAWAPLERAWEAGGFGHRAHLEVGFGLLRDHGFTDALAIYAAGLRALTERAGRPGAYHATVTGAFLSLLAERMEAAPGLGPDELLTANPDLLAQDCLGRLYSEERLRSPMARRVFLMPDKGSAS